MDPPAAVGKVELDVGGAAAPEALGRRRHLFPRRVCKPAGLNFIPRRRLPDLGDGAEGRGVPGDTFRAETACRTPRYRISRLRFIAFPATPAYLLRRPDCAVPPNHPQNLHLNRVKVCVASSLGFAAVSMVTAGALRLEGLEHPLLVDLLPSFTQKSVENAKDPVTPAGLA